MVAMYRGVSEILDDLDVRQYNSSLWFYHSISRGHARRSAITRGKSNRIICRDRRLALLRHALRR